MHRDTGASPRAGSRRVALCANVLFPLALITGCAGTGVVGSSRPTFAAPSSAPAPTDAAGVPAPVEPAPFAPSGADPSVTVIFRLAVAIDGRARFFSPGSIHFVRTDLLPAWHPEQRLVVKGDPRVRSLGPNAEGWYEVALAPGRYHLNVVSRWHVPTPRAVPPFLLELPAGDRVAYAGSIELNCRDLPSPDRPGSRLFDCDRPTIRTDEAAKAALLSGEATVEPAIRPALPLSELAAPAVTAWARPWTLETGPRETVPISLQPFPQFHQAGPNTALNTGTAVTGSLTCGPMFLFCAAVMVPVVAVTAAADFGAERHGNRVREVCSDRLAREILHLEPEERFRARLRERFREAGQPLAEPASAPGEPAPAIALRVAVLRIGVRGDDCTTGKNPFKPFDRYRADILASVQAVDSATGAVLYEEFLSNTDKIPPWELVAGRGSVTPVGRRAACRRANEFCPKQGEDVLDRDLEPAIDAFADHVVGVLAGGAPRSDPPP